MSEQTEAHRRTARRLVELLNAHDAGGVTDLLAEGFVTHTPGLPADAGREAMRGHCERLVATFPDLHYAVEAEVAQGDEVVYRLRASGTQLGELLGIAPSGASASWEEMHIFRFGTDGRIVEHWGLMDTASMMMQLGRMPPVERW